MYLTLIIGIFLGRRKPKSKLNVKTIISLLCDDRGHRLVKSEKISVRSNLTKIDSFPFAGTRHLGNSMAPCSMGDEYLGNSTM